MSVTVWIEWECEVKHSWIPISFLHFIENQFFVVNILLTLFSLICFCMRVFVCMLRLYSEHAHHECVRTNTI